MNRHVNVAAVKKFNFIIKKKLIHGIQLDLSYSVFVTVTGNNLVWCLSIIIVYFNKYKICFA